MRPIHLFGLVLWRGGLLVAASAAVFVSIRWLLRWIDLPLQLEVGTALIVAGIILVFVSLVLERLEAFDEEEEGLSE